MLTETLEVPNSTKVIVETEEARCTKCNAQLSYGQNKEGGGLFVKNWDKENRRPMPNRGWYVYGKDNHHNQDAPPARQSNENHGDAYDGPPPPGNGSDIPF